MTDEEDRLKRIKRLLDSEADTRAEPPIEPKKDETDAEAVSATGTTRVSLPHTPTPPPPIELDEHNLPLPRRVNEVDLEGTRVTPVAYEAASRPRDTQTGPRRVPPPTEAPEGPGSGVSDDRRVVLTFGALEGAPRRCVATIPKHDRRIAGEAGARRPVWARALCWVGFVRPPVASRGSRRRR